VGHLRGVPETGGNGDATVSATRLSQVASGLPNDTEKDGREFAIGRDSTLTTTIRNDSTVKKVYPSDPTSPPLKKKEKQKERYRNVTMSALICDTVFLIRRDGGRGRWRGCGGS